MYKVEVKECSKTLSSKERVLIKDTTDAIKLDKATESGAVLIKPSFYATLLIENDKSEDGEYETYIIVDENGDKYVTGSDSFWNSFKNIVSEMENSDEEWAIKAYRSESKNRAGKYFITCSIV